MCGLLSDQGSSGFQYAGLSSVGVRGFCLGSIQRFGLKRKQSERVQDELVSVGVGDFHQRCGLGY